VWRIPETPLKLTLHARTATRSEGSIFAVCSPRRGDKNCRSIFYSQSVLAHGAQ
jgi:hypothetical protein